MEHLNIMMAKRSEFQCKRIGQDIQIKIALTCAKDNVAPGDDNALPGEKEIVATGETFQAVVTEDKEIKPKVEPTAEEKQNVADLLRSLGL